MTRIIVEAQKVWKSIKEYFKINAKDQEYTICMAQNSETYDSNSSSVYHCHSLRRRYGYPSKNSHIHFPICIMVSKACKRYTRFGNHLITICCELYL